MRRTALIVIVVVLIAGMWRISHYPRFAKTGLGGAGAKIRATNAGKAVPAPSFSLQDLDGHSLDLANYRGKVVLLNFWATWCAPCREEIPHFVELQSKYAAGGLQIIGISMDDGPKPVREFYREFKLNYPVAIGTEQVAEAYGGVLGLPVTFLIDRQGRIATKYTGAVQMAMVEQGIRSLLQEK